MYVGVYDVKVVYMFGFLDRIWLFLLSGIKSIVHTLYTGIWLYIVVSRRFDVETEVVEYVEKVEV